MRRSDRRKRLVLLLSSLVLALVPDAAAAGATFTGVGFAELATSSRLRAVSADGSVAVGAGGGAIRWTAGNGVVRLDDAPGVSDSAWAVSADGSTAAGRAGAVWTGLALTEVVEGPPEATDVPQIQGISGDGTLVVGYVHTARSVNGEPFAHRDGVAWILPPLQGDNYLGYAQDATMDGATIVGCRAVQAPIPGLRPMLWSDEAVVELPGFPYLEGCLYAITPDGSRAVGYASNRTGVIDGFLWDGEVTPLPDLPGGLERAYAYATCEDGSTVVGRGHDASGAVALVWLDRGPARSLREILETDHGLDLAGWTLQEATGISDDCTTIVGFGTNPQGATEGFVARFAPDPPCANGEDDDGDGQADFPQDPGCRTPASLREDPACQDGVDNDGDGGVDFDGGLSAGSATGAPADPSCVGLPWGGSETGPRCGLGFEFVLALGVARARRRRAS